MATQQEFLRSAMVELNLSPDEFARRINCERRTLDRWLLLSENRDHVAMGEAIWVLVREILSHERARVRQPPKQRFSS